MVTAHVNEQGIVFRYSVSENLSPDGWEELLDELKSHYIPSFYQYGKRMHVDFGGEAGKIRSVIYFTPKTVTMDEAVAILKRRNINVVDVRKHAAEQ